MSNKIQEAPKIPEKKPAVIQQPQQSVRNSKPATSSRIPYINDTKRQQEDNERRTEIPEESGFSSDEEA